MKRRLAILVAALALGCAESDQPATPPTPNWAAFPDNAGRAIRRAHEAFLAAPRDPQRAGRLAMLLQAYEQWETALAYYAIAERGDPGSARWPYLRGLTAERAGDPTQAERAYHRALGVEPTYVPARLRLAALRLAAGDVGEAEELYRSVLKLAPDSATALAGLGETAVARGDDRAAIEHFRRALDLAPEFSPARYALAQALRRAGEAEAAQAELRRFEREPKSGEIFPDPWLVEVEALAADSATNSFLRGKRLADRGLHREAIEAYEQALADDPNMAQAHVNLMSSYGALGDHEVAERHYRLAVELGSDDPEMHYNLGVLRSFQERFEEAIPAFESALERNPSLADAHSNLGYALERVGRLGEALGHYRRAVEERPDHRLARYHLARALAATDKPAQALQHLDQLVASDDEMAARALFQAARAKAALERPADAAADLERSRRLAEKLGLADLAAAIQAQESRDPSAAR